MSWYIYIFWILFFIWIRIEYNKKQKKREHNIYSAKALNSYTKTEKTMLDMGYYIHQYIVDKEGDFKSWLQKTHQFDLSDVAYAKSRFFWLLEKSYKEGFSKVFIENPNQQIVLQDMLALDCSYIAKLSQVALAEEIVDEEKIWGILLLNTVRILDMFDSQEVYEEACIRAIIYLDQLENEEIFDFNKTQLEYQKKYHTSFEWIDKDNMTHCIKNMKER